MRDVGDEESVHPGRTTALTEPTSQLRAIRCRVRIDRAEEDAATRVFGSR
jgi:hypothetical protein